MFLESKWLFVLLGNDKTGKTTLQKKIINLISDDNRNNRLDCNVSINITHPYLIRKINTISFSNRSYQEKKDIYGSVEQYFASHFKYADLCIISSHLILEDINQMILQGHRKYFNVCGIFLSNSTNSNPDDNSNISELNWDERLYAANTKTDDPIKQDQQLQKIAETFIQMLIQRTLLW